LAIFQYADADVSRRHAIVTITVILRGHHTIAVTLPLRRHATSAVIAATPLRLKAEPFYATPAT